MGEERSRALKRIREVFASLEGRDPGDEMVELFGSEEEVAEIQRWARDGLGILYGGIFLAAFTAGIRYERMHGGEGMDEHANLMSNAKETA